MRTFSHGRFPLLDYSGGKPQITFTIISRSNKLGLNKIFIAKNSENYALCDERVNSICLIYTLLRVPIGTHTLIYNTVFAYNGRHVIWWDFERINAVRHCKNGNIMFHSAPCVMWGFVVGKNHCIQLGKLRQDSWQIAQAIITFCGKLGEFDRVFIVRMTSHYWQALINSACLCSVDYF